MIIAVLAFFHALSTAFNSKESESSFVVFIANFIFSMVGLTFFCGLLYLIVMISALAVQHVMG